MRVQDLPVEAKFYCDSQDVEFAKSAYPELEGFDSFFSVIEDCVLTNLWGMEGIIPYLDRAVYPVYPNQEEAS